MKRKIGIIVMIISCIISINATAAVVFRDNFEYVVGREDPNAASIFVSQGRWWHAKTYQSGEPGAVGWLYTTNSIPGYPGSFPGTASTRVLAIEARPATLRPGEGINSQTDVYLQLGTGEATVIPANAWIQFWIYSNYYGDQLSTYANRNKMIYPCNGSYPCTSGQWLWMSGKMGCSDPDINDGLSTNQFICMEAATANRGNASDPGLAWRLGQNLNTSSKILANTWTLVKLHIDTSGSQGKYEAWLRTLSGGWIKVTEYIGGVTPNFTWPVTPEGQRMFRMPTVINYYDSWQYMDDFVIATTEADLPVYGAPPLKKPAPIQILGVTPRN